MNRKISWEPELLWSFSKNSPFFFRKKTYPHYFSAKKRGVFVGSKRARFSACQFAAKLAKHAKVFGDVTVTGNLWPLLVFKEKVASEKLWRFLDFFLRIRGFFLSPLVRKINVISIHSFPTHSWYQRLLRRHLETLHCSDEQCSKPRNLGLSWILFTFATISVQHFSNSSHQQNFFK